jgi:hypothetical protein
MKRAEMSKGQRVMVKRPTGGWREGRLMEPKTMAVTYEKRSTKPGQGWQGAMRKVLIWGSTGAQVGYPVMTRASGLTSEGELPALCGELCRGRDIEDWDAHHARAQAITAEKLRLKDERERNVEAMRERASKLPLSASQVAALAWVPESWKPGSTEPCGRLSMTISELERFAAACVQGYLDERFIEAPA